MDKRKLINKIVYSIGTFSLGACISVIAFYRLVKKHLVGRRAEINSYKAYYEMMKKWIPLYQKGVRLHSYFLDKNYKRIAICGMGDMGVLFYEDVKNSDIEIAYVIKIHEGEKNIGIDVVEIDDDMKEVDAIIVCEIGAFDYVNEKLEDRVDYPIIALDDIVYELF